jgi:hypothetical protein
MHLKYPGFQDRLQAANFVSYHYLGTPETYKKKPEPSFFFSHVAPAEDTTRELGLHSSTQGIGRGSEALNNLRAQSMLLETATNSYCRLTK